MKTVLLKRACSDGGEPEEDGDCGRQQPGPVCPNWTLYEFRRTVDR
jgi:hypothetical protein